MLKYILTDDEKKCKQLEEFFNSSNKKKLSQFTEKSVIQRYFLSFGEKLLYIKKGRNEYLLCGENIEGENDNDWNYLNMKENYNIYYKSKNLSLLREKFLFLALKNLHMENWGEKIEKLNNEEKKELKNKEIEYEIPLF